MTNDKMPEVNEIWETGKGNKILFTYADYNRFYGIYSSGKCASLTRNDIKSGNYKFIRKASIDFQKLFKEGRILSILGKIA